MAPGLVPGAIVHFVVNWPRLPQFRHKGGYYSQNA
jgi:hypothetical protein